MNWQVLSAALAALLSFASQSAKARVVTLESDAKIRAEIAPLSSIVASPTPLRSAFFLRASRLDHATLAATPAERQFQIQRHFDLVLATLVAQSERSLDVALDRLQAARAENWTAADRDAWRQTLAHRRLINMRRLRLYQLRGLFPQNEHVAGCAVPIFVDNHDTACAVGHLMRESGATAAVAAIVRANNFVYVADLHDGPLVDWVLVSGLTQEEAALIQPAYYPSFLFDAGLDVVTQGSAITKNGLIYDNFHFMAGELTEPDLFPQVPPPVNQVILSQFGAGVHRGEYHDLGGFFDPVYEDWIFIGSKDFEFGIYPTTAEWGLLYSFDVMPIAPQRRIVAAAFENEFGFSYNYVGDGLMDFQSRIYPGSASEPLLAELHMRAGPGPRQPVNGEDFASLGPQRKVTVVTAIRIQGEAGFTSHFHSFQVVPEPTSVALAALACILAFQVRRRCAAP